MPRGAMEAGPRGGRQRAAGRERGPGAGGGAPGIAAECVETKRLSFMLVGGTGHCRRGSVGGSGCVGDVVTSLAGPTEERCALPLAPQRVQKSSVAWQAALREGRRGARWAPSPPPPFVSLARRTLLKGDGRVGGGSGGQREGSVASLSPQRIGVLQCVGGGVGVPLEESTPLRSCHGRQMPWLHEANGGSGIHGIGMTSVMV